MRLRDIIIWSACVILAAALLIVAGMQLDFINSQRLQMKLISNEPLKNAPPSLAFATVAMGAFRGLVVDALWLRADRLKEQGQFFDAKQIAEWITTLQPRFASVWEFHSWNMAYNISVAIPATQPDQRWQWVKNGYELLRDQGIPLNPRSILLYRQLALTFQHKIGGVTDDAHEYYKLQLAMAMEPLLCSEDNLLSSADERYFKALVEAPANWRQIMEDANLAPLITALKSADKAFADDDKFVNNYLSLRQNPARFNPNAFKTIDNFRGTEALKKFDIFAKAYHLRNTWKLDPLLMQQMNELYGPVDWSDPNKHLPLDWRHPDSHAIYWAARGLQMAGREEFSVDEINTDRIVNHSLQNLFRHGRIFIYKPLSPAPEPPQPGSPKSATLDTSRELTTPSLEIFLRPDLRMFQTYNDSVLAVIEKYKDIEKRGSFESLQTGHRNMLENAVLLFYQAGLQRQAQKIYNQLRQLYPRDEFKVPLVVFAKNRLIEELQYVDLFDAREMIQMLLRESYFIYAMRDDDEAFGREKLAKEVHDHYQSLYRDENRIDLPDFKWLRYSALLDFLNDQQYPLDLRRNLFGRIKIERPELAEQLERQEEKLLKQVESQTD